ncbi:MAG: Na/Pi cotransporter family protein [Oscillospiraceae bacterium]|nr:Na/Pi cotransporter family protein [Oscillospiraceae bacterium]
MITIFDFISMLGGLAFFLYGMNMLSASLEKMSATKLTQILEKLTGKVWKSVALGLAVTAVIQSSSATTVITVGLVNSGILKLGQAIGIIMGSNIGTTVTSHLLRLTEIDGSQNILMTFLKPDTFAPICAIVGAALAMFTKKIKSRAIGEVLMGFGMLFIGMDIMESSLAPLRESQLMADLFMKFGDNPILGILVGAGVTAVIQSSSASVGILQALSVTGAISWSAAIPIILGQNIGTTITAILSVIGASKNAKRTALAHLYFNVIGTVIFTAAVFIIQGIGIGDFWDMPIDKSGIANFHTLFNCTMVALLLPFTKQLEKLCMLTIPADGTEIDSDTSELAPGLLSTPYAAIMQSEIILAKLMNVTRDSVHDAMDMLNGKNPKLSERINEEHTAILRMTDNLRAYLLKIAECDLSDEQTKAVSEMLRRADDCVHIIEHCVKIRDTAEDINAKGKSLTNAGKQEIKVLSVALDKLMDSAADGSNEKDKRADAKVEPLYFVVTEMTELIRSRHMERLKNGECSHEAGSLFVGTLIDIERIAKHCSSLGVSLALQFKNNSLSDQEFARRIHRGDTEHFMEHYIDYKNEYYTPLVAE